ncbi:MAG: hypothetical protein LBJ32_00450, partial [Oscillospiraceae bacterium]|nr:hypothetical protein [Oscillospiraceae bacterium]
MIKLNYKYCLSGSSKYAREKIFAKETIVKAEKEINQVSLKTGEKNKTSFLKVLATGLAIFLAIPMTQ